VITDTAANRLQRVRRGWSEVDRLTAIDPAAALELFGVLIGETGLPWSASTFADHWRKSWPMMSA